MGTTPNLDLPYPEGTDLVIGGDDAIQALAEALDASLNPNSALIVMERANSGAALGSTPVAIPIPGTALGLVGFTYDSGVFTYTGAKSRTFMIDVEVQITNGSGGGTVSAESTLTMYVNGSTAIAGSYDKVQHTGTTVEQRSTSHRITTPAQLATGNTFHVSGSCSPAGTIGVVGVRVYPIGPAE
jgi:hypothetical protein